MDSDSFVQVQILSVQQQLLQLLASKKIFHRDQSVLSGTTYDIGKTKEFIHYTSLEAFFSILNEQRIRCNDLNHLNDPKEFESLLLKNGIEIKKEEIDLFKRSLFLFSM